MSPERILERAVVRHCQARGLLTYKFSSPAHRGVPDRIIFGPGGRVMLLELKAPGKRPTLLQAREITRLNALGVMALWIDKVDEAIMEVDVYFR
jgi:hypothetical protein